MREKEEKPLKAKPTISEVRATIADGAPYLFDPEVEAITRFSDTTRWRMERAALFPKRMKITGTRVAWRTLDIVAFIEGRWKPDQAAA